MGASSSVSLAARPSHLSREMGLSVGTFPVPAHPLLWAARCHALPASCDRATVCDTVADSVTRSDCFERGPVPFADFLYHQNRKLELEIPRSQATIAPGPELAPSECRADAAPPSENLIASSPSNTDTPVDRRGRDGAIVLNLPRPALVAQFIDLYA